MCTNPDMPSRRDVLRGLTLTGAAALATGTVPSMLQAMSSRADGARGVVPAPTTPAEALDMLYQGNARFADGKITAPHRNMERLKEIAAGQKPFAAFLGCADSRVPIEIVFDQGFGDVFVTRIAGNVADPAIIGSLEYGVEVLGAQVLYVLGHSKCGAVAATVKGDAVPGQISTLYQHIRRAVKESNGNLDVAIQRNVEIQAEILSEASPVLARRVADKSLIIAGGVYDLASGKVTPVKLPAR